MEVKKTNAKGVLAEMVANIDEESLAKTREEMMEQAKHPIVYTEELGYEAVKKIEQDESAPWFKVASEVWKPLAASPSIGNCDEMRQMICGAFIEAYNRLPTDQEYLDAQIAYAEHPLYNQYSIWARSRTTDEWWTLGEVYRNSIKKKCPEFPFGVEDCLYAALYHAVTQTMVGKRAEEELADKVISQSTKRELEYPSGDEDAEFGVDLMAYFGNYKYGIQVKPSSFFNGAYSGKKKDIVEDSNNLIKKNSLAIEHFGLDGMLFAIYEARRDNENEWFYKEVNGRKKFLFTIDELYDVDTKTLNCFTNGKIKYEKCVLTSFNS